MLKKRHSTVKVFIALLAVIVCFIGALIAINAKLGLSEETIIGISSLVAVALTWAAFSVSVGREATVIEQPSNYPPDEINSIKAGYLIDGELTTRDIVSGLYYLAQRGYMDIVEYAPREFGFAFKRFPEEEDAAIQTYFRAIFGDNGEGSMITLTDSKERLANAVPRIRNLVIKSVKKKKNREIADMTGKVIGFEKALINTKGDKLEYIIQRNDDYFFKVLPYAYSFAITSKLSSNFGPIKVNMPSWYKAYNIDDNYEFDVVFYNAMLKYLPEQFKSLVIDELNEQIKVGLK